MIDRYKVAEIEAAADVVVWCCDEAPGFAPTRAAGPRVRRQHRAGDARLRERRAGRRSRSRFADCDRIIAIGSDRMMAAVGAARHTRARALSQARRIARIGSINSPMQCMMKEICAQCLQPHRDPATGKVSYVFSCFNQDQPLDDVDFPGLAARLAAERRAGEADRALGRARLGARHAGLTAHDFVRTIPRWAVVAVVALVATWFDVAVAADAGGAADATPPELRIPPGARPLRYDVKLTVAPGEADVAGEAAIDIELDRPHPILWLNAVGLSIGDVGVDVTGTNVRVAANRDQFLGLAFEPPLPAGRHRVTLAYRAPQNRNSSRGIFTLQDGDAWYTMTHFEPMAARQAFPCFDEPGFKVPWQLTLRVPRAMVAVSNTPVVSETGGRRDGQDRSLRADRAAAVVPRRIRRRAVGCRSAPERSAAGRRRCG